MKIIYGKTNLSIVLSSLEKLILNSVEYKNHKDSTAKDKIIDGFFEKMLLSPLVFYVPNKTLVENKIDDNFEIYAKDIFYIEHLYELLLCMNLSPLAQKNIDVNWIICEMNLSVQKTRAFHDVAFLDHYLDKDEEKLNTNGRLNYALMDAIFMQYFNKSDLKKFLQTPRKYFFSAIFGVISSERKGQYAKQEPKYIDSPNSIKATEKDKKLKYSYHCPICDAQHLVYLNGNKNENVGKHIHLHGQYVEFLCAHEQTRFSQIVKFGFDAVKTGFILQTDEQYNQAFLYLFYLAKYNNGKIDFYKNEKEIISMPVEKFHALRNDND